MAYYNANGEDKFPNLSDLKKNFSSFSETLDTVNPDLGASHYKQAKKRTLSIRSKTREKNYKDLKDIFNQPQSTTPSEPAKKKTLAELFAQDQQQSQQQSSQQPDETTPPSSPALESEESLKSKACKKFRPGPFMKNRCSICNQLGKYHADFVDTTSNPYPKITRAGSQGKLITSDPSTPTPTSPTLSRTEKTPEPVKVAEEPVKTSEPEPVKTSEPEPVKEAEPEPVKQAEPEPVKQAEPEKEEREEKEVQLDVSEKDIPKQESDINLTASGIPLIKSDKDLAVILMDLVHEKFYSPKKGFWPDYDKSFVKESFTKWGELGWDSKNDTDHRNNARSKINEVKNKEITRVMETRFVEDAIEDLFETVNTIVEGVKRKDVKHAVRNHIRFHLYFLIYGKS